MIIDRLEKIVTFRECGEYIHFRQFVIPSPSDFHPMSNNRHRDEGCFFIIAVNKSCTVAHIHDTEDIKMIFVPLFLTRFQSYRNGRVMAALRAITSAICPCFAFQSGPSNAAASPIAYHPLTPSISQWSLIRIKPEPF